MVASRGTPSTSTTLNDGNPAAEVREGLTNPPRSTGTRVALTLQMVDVKRGRQIGVPLLAAALCAGACSESEHGSAGPTDSRDTNSLTDEYRVSVDTPVSGDVSGRVIVSGHAPGFVNVEVWDGAHQSPPLGRTVPDGAGNFSLTVDTAPLAEGPTQWTVFGWDVPAGETPNHSDSVDLSLTIRRATGGDAPPPPPVEPPSPPTPPMQGAIMPRSPVSGTYHLTFDDEFDTLSMQNPDEDGTRSPTDTARGWWRPVFNWAGSDTTLDSRYIDSSEAHYNASNNEKQWYVWNQYRLENGEQSTTDVFSSKNGILTVTGRPLDTHERDVEDAKLIQWGLEYFSGLMTTFPTFSQQYGYFELSAQMPKDGPGLWPAFWLLPDDFSWPPELDIFEFIGSGGAEPNGGFQNAFETIHFDGNGKPDGEGVVRALPNGAHADDGFHVYGFEWLPDQMVFFIDGVETYRQYRAIDKRMYILVNLAIGGSWPGDPTSATPWPAQMKLDYVRAFAKAPVDHVSGPR